jgi:hypothetical protein
MSVVQRMKVSLILRKICHLSLGVEVRVICLDNSIWIGARFGCLRVVKDRRRARGRRLVVCHLRRLRSSQAVDSGTMDYCSRRPQDDDTCCS